jgi:hypothetical protein
MGVVPPCDLILMLVKYPYPRAQHRHAQSAQLGNSSHPSITAQAHKPQP